MDILSIAAAGLAGDLCRKGCVESCVGPVSCPETQVPSMPINTSLSCVGPVSGDLCRCVLTLGSLRLRHRSALCWRAHGPVPQSPAQNLPGLMNNNPLSGTTLERERGAAPGARRCCTRVTVTFR